MFSFDDFPNLSVGGFTKTSEETWDYNCIGWAAGDDQKWWWPLNLAPNGKSAYWPRRAPKKSTIPAFVKMFADRGFKVVRDNDPSLEEGYEKVAIFAFGQKPKHAARQMPSGRWTHKMGQSIDLETDTLKAVEGPKYGTVVRVLKRKIK